MASMRAGHTVDADTDLFTGVRYVEADGIYLSPNFGRQSAVISFIITGTKLETGPVQSTTAQGHVIHPR
jgi:hypothetical protein